MSKKIFSISSYDPYHPKANSLLEDFKKQAEENYQKCYPKIPIENFKGRFDYVGTCDGVNYQHIFYGDDLIGYFGYYHTDEHRMIINELYIEEKYMTKKNMNEVLSFVKNIASDLSSKYVSIDVFSFSKKLTSLKSLGGKSIITTLCYDLK